MSSGDSMKRMSYPAFTRARCRGLACRVAVEEPQPDLPDKIGPVHRAVAAQVENFLPALPAEEPAEERLERFAGALPARYELKLPAPDPGDLRRRDDPVDQEIEPEVVDDDRIGVNDHEIRRIDLGKRKIERAGMHLRTGFARTGGRSISLIHSTERRYSVDASCESLSTTITRTRSRFVCRRKERRQSFVRSTVL